MRNLLLILMLCMGTMQVSFAQKAKSNTIKVHIDKRQQSEPLKVAEENKKVATVVTSSSGVKPKAPADLKIDNLVFDDSQGNGNNILDAEELVSVRLRVRNQGKGAAMGVQLNCTFRELISSIAINYPTFIGDLPPGSDTLIVVDLKSERQLPTTFATLMISCTELNGFNADDAAIQFSTAAYRESKLIVADEIFTNSEGSGRIQLGKVVRLDVLIQNQGQGIAEKIKVAFAVPSKVFPATESELEIGSLWPNESRGVTFEFFANKLYEKDEIPIGIAITEERKADTLFKTAIVSLTKTLEQTNVVQIQAKQSNVVPITSASLVPDVDKNIPQQVAQKPNRYALLFGNEDYSRFQKSLAIETNVQFARNDARSMKNYFTQLLGIPETNTSIHLDATSAEMFQAIDKLSKIIKNTQGEAEIYFFYAGHGLPHETTKEAYLMPVDVNGTNVQLGVSLTWLMSELSKFPSKGVTVILDACFTGGARGQELLAMRGIKIQPKTPPVKGNLVVFSASSGEQSALPWHEKQHGLYTYWFLKNLQETEGNISFGEMSGRLEKQVGLHSVLVNSKEQNPQMLIGEGAISHWKEWRFR